jgi:hypothetical protein
MAHTAISIQNLEEGLTNDMATLCVECGEPIFIDHKHIELGFRKPTDKEFSEMAADGRFAHARAGWLELKKLRDAGDPMPVEGMWQHFKANGLESEHLPDQAIGFARRVFFTAVAMALHKFEEMAIQETDVFNAQRDLMRAEIKAFLEIIEDEVMNERSTGEGAGRSNGRSSERNTLRRAAPRRIKTRPN